MKSRLNRKIVTVRLWPSLNKKIREIHSKIKQTNKSFSLSDCIVFILYNFVKNERYDEIGFLNTSDIENINIKNEYCTDSITTQIPVNILDALNNVRVMVYPMRKATILNRKYERNKYTVNSIIQLALLKYVDSLHNVDIEDISKNISSIDYLEIKLFTLQN